MIAVTILSLAEFLPAISNAQTPANTSAAVPRVWEKYFGHNAITMCNVIQTSDGGFAFVAYGLDGRELYKIDASGSLEWKKTLFALEGDDILQDGDSLVETFDGGYLIAGRNSGGIVLIKTNAKGNVQWEKSVSESNTLSSMVQTSDGGFLVSYNDKDYLYFTIDTISSHAYLAKINAYGTTEWTKKLAASGFYNAVNCAIQTSDGGYALAGYTNFDGTRDTLNLYYWMAKTDSNGEVNWSRCYGYGPDTTSKITNPLQLKDLNRFTFGDNEAQSIVQTDDGGYAFLGINYAKDVGTTEIIKTDSLGILLWNQTFDSCAKRFSSAAYRRPYSLIETSDGGLAFTGSRAAWCIKTDSHGTLQLNETKTEITSYGTHFDCGGQCLTQANDGTLLIGGYRNIDGRAWLSGGYVLNRIDAGLPPPSVSPIPTPAPDATLLLRVTIVVVLIIFSVSAVVWEAWQEKSKNKK